MRQRDERIDNAHHKAKDDPLYDKTAVKTLTFFRPEDFQFNDDNTATCPTGKTLATRQTAVQPAHRHRGAGVCEHPSPQGNASLHAQGPGEGEHAVESLLSGAQHREDRPLRVARRRHVRTRPRLGPHQRALTPRGPSGSNRPDMNDTADAVRMDPRIQYSTTLAAFGDGVKTQSR